MLDTMGWLNPKIVFGPIKDSYDHHPELLPDPVLLLPNWNIVKQKILRLVIIGVILKVSMKVNEFCQLQRSKMTPGTIMVIFF